MAGPVRRTKDGCQRRRQQQLAGKLQEKYGLARDEAERQAKDFRSRNNWN
jgi:hypothetical protein